MHPRFSGLIARARFEQALVSAIEGREPLLREAAGL